MWQTLLSSLLFFVSMVLAATSLGEVWDRFASRHIRKLSPKLRALSLETQRLPLYLRCWGISLVSAVLFIALVLRMPPVAIAVGLMVYVAPEIILQFLIQQRRIKLRDQIVGASVALSNCCRAGMTLAQGLEDVSRETPAPLAVELQQIVSDYRHGRPLADAIRAMKNRLNEDGFTLFSSAILISLDRGGRTTDALERISASLQDSQRIERKLAADTASGKSIVYLLAAFPFIYLAGSFLLYPQGTTYMFTTLIGQFILAIIMILVYVGFRWCQKIVEVDV